MKKMILMLSMALVLLITVNASANPLTYNDGLGGHVIFEVLTSGPNSGDLQVTLWSDRTATVNAQVLTALFFNVASNPTFGTISATVPVLSATDGTTNNSFQYEGTNYGFTTPLNVGGEWRYQTGLSGVPGGQTQGIGSSGLNVFAGAPNFGGSDLNNNAGGNIDGGDFGLISLTSTVTSGQGYDVLVKNTTVFLLDAPNGFDPSRDLSDIFIQYGTSFAGTEVPEPATMLLLGSGLIGLWGARRKFKK